MNYSRWSMEWYPTVYLASGGHFNAFSSSSRDTRIFRDTQFCDYIIIILYLLHHTEKGSSLLTAQAQTDKRSRPSEVGSAAQMPTRINSIIDQIFMNVGKDMDDWSA